MDVVIAPADFAKTLSNASTHRRLAFVWTYLEDKYLAHLMEVLGPVDPVFQPTTSHDYPDQPGYLLHAKLLCGMILLRMNEDQGLADAKDILEYDLEHAITTHWCNMITNQTDMLAEDRLSKLHKNHLQWFVKDVCEHLLAWHQTPVLVTGRTITDLHSNLHRARVGKESRT